MRLLNVHDLTLRVFPAAEIPKYIITSHRWFEDEEALIDDIRKGLDLSKSGHRKVKRFAEYVASNIKGIHWIWHDTCCIDKASSQELTTAINSMFKWYLNAEVCLAYLHDVPTAEDMGVFSTSTWFKRGWTLQELLAPHLVVFLTEDWHIIGHKGSDGRGKSGSSLDVGPLLTSRISAITQIPNSVLHDYAESQRFDARAKLQWAIGRETTIEEDMVYCLFGMFDVTMPILYSEGVDKAKRRLLKEVVENGNVLTTDDLIVGAATRASLRAPALHTVTARPTYLPFERNPQFVGRADELAILKRKLIVEKDCQKMAIVGLGGIGKTQLVLSFAYSVMDKRLEFSVFWMSALSMETFEQAFDEIAQSCEIQGASGSKDDIKQLVKRHLSSVAAGYWLLVVDNIDDTDLLQDPEQDKGLLDYLPESALGLTVFTTRNLEIAQSLVGSDVVMMEQMAQKEALDLLVNSLVEKDAACDAAATAELLEELDYLPLAITQAAAYININKISTSQYASLLHGTERDLVGILSTEIRDRTRYKQAANAVATTWIVSFKQIVERDAVAADLLGYISCIEWKAIPKSILPQVESQVQMTSALGRLCSYSFLTRRREGKMYDMHRLVHLAIQIWIGQNGEADEIRENAMRTILKVFPSDDYTNRQTWREQMPHVANMCRDGQCDNVSEKGEVCLMVGRCLLVDGRGREAVIWLKRSRDLRQKLVEDHPGRLASQHALAVAYQANGQVKDAVKLLEHVVRMKEVLVEDHPDRLSSQHALAFVYGANGQVKDAVKMLEHVVRIQEVLAEDHPNRLASQHALAVAYRANGQVKDAVKLLEHVVRIRKEVLADDHPDRLASQHALAAAYCENGQVKDAVKLLEHVVRIRKEVLAEDHPNRLVSQHALAAAYCENRQVKDAVKLLEHVVRIRKEVLVDDHPDRLESQHALAVAYRANGQVKDAVKLLEHVVRIRKEVLAEDHPDRLASQVTLELAYQTNEDSRPDKLRTRPAQTSQRIAEVSISQTPVLRTNVIALPMRPDRTGVAKNGQQPQSRRKDDLRWWRKLTKKAS